MLAYTEIKNIFDVKNTSYILWVKRFIYLLKNLALIET